MVSISVYTSFSPHAMLQGGERTRFGAHKKRWCFGYFLYCFIFESLGITTLLRGVASMSSLWMLPQPYIHILPPKWSITIFGEVQLLEKTTFENSLASFGAGFDAADSNAEIFLAGHNSSSFAETCYCERFGLIRKCSGGLVKNRRSLRQTKMVSVQAAKPAGIPTSRFACRNVPVGKLALPVSLPFCLARLFSKRILSSLDYKYPFFRLERVRSSIHFRSLCSLTHHCKHQKAWIPLSTHPKPNPFGRKQEEVLIYVFTKTNLIPLWFHRASLLLLGLWKPEAAKCHS
jgi:hypothetical protein